MDALTIIIMVVLFVLAMLFVFSTALLTPYIGKKNLISVLLLGLIVGVAAGAFLLSPISEDIPDFTRTLVEESVDGNDNIELDLSTNGNLTQIIQNISSIEGVEKVDYNGITVKIDEEFDSNTEKQLIMTALNNSDPGVSDIKDKGNNTFFLEMTDNADPQSVLDNIYKTFSRETYTHLKYTSMQANVTVKAKQVTRALNQISENDVVVLNVTGPTETQSAMINKVIPTGNNLIIVSGILGVIVAAAGFFVDSLITFIGNLRKKRNKKPSRKENIKRKVVPGTEKQKGSPRRNRRNKKKSIDIFDDSFDNSPKQNIGSNKHFKQLTVDDFQEEKTVKQEKPKKRFSFRRSSNKDEKQEQKTESEKKTRNSQKRGTPRFRPKRRE
ncbi:hypothetical protein PXD04_06610 [Methanosphaera sp. ISO3-F5]|uniref:hypothetical protein n=1 Tax=Methanosphaera sp. ISO3-F5 TaxID=1452353 RepID=UPI002B25B630|nr:hypothetical protein [Methanosphaera sp. ISO3-F5]WQH63377.1 hypothetical protein PXD04_06610 [Methanosphaera sp. ISO3-F5]